MSLLDIIYEKAGECASRVISKIKYADFDLLIISESETPYEIGMINVTQMCKLGGREFKYWHANEASKNFIDYLEPLYGRSHLLTRLNGTKRLSGTYAHKDIVPHVAMWLSTIFAHKVSMIINAKMIEENMAKDKKISDLNAKLEEFLNVSRTTHDCFLQVNDKLTSTTDALINTNNTLDMTCKRLALTETSFDLAIDTIIKNEDKLTSIENKMDKLVQGGDLETKIDMISGILEENDQKIHHLHEDLLLVLKDRAIPPSTPSKAGCFTVIRLDDTAIATHYITCCQYGTFRAAHKKNPGDIIYQIECTNPKYLLNRLKETKLPNVERGKINTFTMVPEVESIFIKTIEGLNDANTSTSSEETVLTITYTEATLNQYTVKELKGICSQLGIKGYSDKRKQLLIKHILTEQ
jgi:hypothetical protein